MTIEQAKAVKVDFGRFSGWSLGEIAMKSPGDLAWYVKNYSGHNLALKAGATKLFGNGRPDGQLILPLAK